MSIFKREFEKLHERFDGLESRFDKLESKVDDGFEKTGKSFIAISKPLEVHCGDEGVEASEELKEIWEEKHESTRFDSNEKKNIEYVSGRRKEYAP